MEQQNNNDNVAIAIVAFARVAYTIILGSLTGWLLNVKGFDHGFLVGSAVCSHDPVDGKESC